MPLRHWFRPRRMLVLFLGTMSVFAAGAAWLAWRFVEQDRALQSQQILERLESVADLVATELRQGLTGLDSNLEALSSMTGDELENAALAALSRLPADALIVVAGPEGLSVYPAGRLVYRPDTPNTPILPFDTFAEGEALEFRTQEYDRAIATFRRQAGSDDDLLRAGALLRLARACRKAGRTDEALSAYDELGALGGTPVDGLPAELLARHAKCGIFASQSRRAELRGESQRLRKRLLAGAWAIDRGTFIHYTEEAGALFRLAGDDGGANGVGQPHGSFVESDVREALALASGLEIMWAEWTGGDDARPGRATRDGTDASGRAIHEIEGIRMLLIWHRTGDTIAGLIGGPNTLLRELIAPLESLLERQGAALVLGDGTGLSPLWVGLPPQSGPSGTEPLSGGSEVMESGAAGAPQIRRASAETGLPWQLQIVSADPSADRARLAARRRLLLIVSGFVVFLITAGTYLSTRAVARELEVARQQSEFVSAVSHDFRTPLTSLRQVTDALIGDRVAEDRRRDYYDIQKRGIERLHRLVEGLLDFGRMEAGAREFERQPIQAKPWIERVVADFRCEIDKQGYSVELSWSCGDQQLIGDEPALTRALWNLLDNAVKYSPDCKTVWIECRAGGETKGGAKLANTWSGSAGEYFVVSVRDRGLGIDPAERQEIFAKFVRGSAATVSSSSGTGLGLTMVERIVRAHGGDIDVEGKAGEGSTFTVRLPLGDWP